MTIGSAYVGSKDTDNFYSSTQWNGEDDPDRLRENAYTRLVESGIRSDGDYCSRIWCRPCETDPNFGCGPYKQSFYPNNPASADWGALELKNLGKIADDIRGHELDLGNSIAEGRQTVDLAKGALRDIAKSARHLKHGNFAEAARILGGGSKENNLADKLSTKSIADRHLAYVYGIAPLLSDVYESGKAWEAVTAGPRHKDYVRTSSKTDDLSFWYPANTAKWTGDSRYSVRQRVRVSEDASTQRKLGLLDPAGIAWELVPFSFVADWFLPISDYLDTLNLFNGLNATVLTTRKHTVQTRVTEFDPYYTWDSWYGGMRTYPTAEQHWYTFTRTFSPIVSVPAPRFKPLEKALSPAHITNAAALARAALSDIRDLFLYKSGRRSK